MGIEIEKKYRLGMQERERLVARLAEIGAVHLASEFEENIIYRGGNLSSKRSVLRLRKVDGHALLTYKERFASASAIKRQREEETRVEDAEVMAVILDALGYTPAIIYEKRRETWRLARVLLMIDELPFGLFAEIEGDEQAILEAERQLSIADAEAELATYPQLTAQYGVRNGEAIEARFKKQ